MLAMSSALQSAALLLGPMLLEVQYMPGAQHPTSQNVLQSAVLQLAYMLLGLCWHTNANVPLAGWPVLLKFRPDGLLPCPKLLEVSVPISLVPCNFSEIP